MPDDPIAVLENELVAAARRRARHGRARVRFGALVPAAAAVVALVIAAGALVLLSGRSHPAPSTATASPSRQLTDVLGVLRRPQTRADLVAFKRTGIFKGPATAMLGGSVSVQSVRVAGTTPWGSRVLVGLVRPSSVAVMSLHHKFRGIPARLHSIGGLVVISQGLACCSTAPDVVSHGVTAMESAPGSARLRILMLVPDGVARVAFHYPAWAMQDLGPRYRRGETVTAQVHGNLAAAQLRHTCCLEPQITWYGADGAVLKRLRSVNAPRNVAIEPQAAVAGFNPAPLVAPNPMSVSPADARPRRDSTSASRCWPPARPTRTGSPARPAAGSRRPAPSAASRPSAARPRCR